jgi:hypothetical protein
MSSPRTAPAKVEEPPAPILAATVDAGKQVGAWLDTVGSKGLTEKDAEALGPFARVADADEAKGLRHFEETLTVPPEAPFNSIRRC